MIQEAGLETGVKIFGIFSGGQWAVLSSIVLSGITLIIWYLKLHTKKTTLAIEKAKNENREYTRQRDAFRSSMEDSAKKQFSELLYGLGDVFFKKIRDIDSEFKLVNNNPTDRLLKVSRKSEPLLHHNESDIKSRFYTEAETVFSDISKQVIVCYDEYGIFKSIQPFLLGIKNELADTYQVDLQKRAEVYTKSLQGRLRIDTWSHSIVEESISEVIIESKVKTIIHSIFENFCNREKAIEERSTTY